MIIKLLDTIKKGLAVALARRHLADPCELPFLIIHLLDLLVETTQRRH
jgi:hypothetical protein